MLSDGEGADVTFTVDSQLFRAHICVLAFRSPGFRAQLFGPMKEKAKNLIRIDDMEPALCFTSSSQIVFLKAAAMAGIRRSHTCWLLWTGMVWRG
jgi:hypothetical protein